MKKRILIFSTAYLPFVGGAEVAVKEITDRISDLEFVMITAKLDPKLSAIERVGNIEVHRLGKGNNWDKYRLIWLGARYARNLGYFDAVWGIMASYAGFAAMRLKTAKNTPCLPAGRPFLLTLQEGDSKWDIYKHVWWCWPYFKQIFKHADKIQAISNYLAGWAKKMGAKCSIEVVPNGVDIEKFEIRNSKFETNIKYQISNIKKQLNISNSDKIVITVSRLVKKNGISDLIKAIKILNIKYSILNTHLLIAGEGELKNKLVKLVNQLGLAGRVHFLGNVNHEELPKYLWASDVFCRPSLSEGLGSAFLEAMASGLPVVGTKVGGIPDFLKNNETGLFCKVGEPKDIAENIKKILDDNNLREKLIENSKKLVEEKYNWNLIADKMRNIFEML